MSTPESFDDETDIWALWEAEVETPVVEEKPEEKVQPTAEEITAENAKRRAEYEAKLAAEIELSKTQYEAELAQLREDWNQENQVIKDATETLKAVNKAIDDDNDAIAEIQREMELKIQAVKDEQAKKRAEKDKLTKLKYFANQQQSEIERKAEELKRKLALEQQKLDQEKRKAEQYLTIEDATRDKLWRQRAYRHQWEGVLFLAAAQRALCADQMGLGKTLQSIGWLSALESIKESNGFNLVLCPSDLVSVFQDECDKWDPDRLVVTIAGLGTKSAVETLRYYGAMIDEGVEDNITVLCNYEILPRSKDVREELDSWQFGSVICDEVHRLKETKNSTFQMVKRLVHSYNTCSIPGCGKLTSPSHKLGYHHEDNDAQRRVHCPEHGFVTGDRSVRNFLGMTGTPILNRPDEIFATLHLAYPVAFPDVNKFRDDYCYKNYANKWVWTSGGESRLVNKIRGFYIRRTMEDAGIELPPQKVTVHELQLDAEAYPNQAKLLEDLKDYSQLEIQRGHVHTVPGAMARITRQRQATTWPGGMEFKVYDPELDAEKVIRVSEEYWESQKMDAVCELMDEFDESGTRYVVFSLFKKALKELKRRRGDTVVEFHGDVSTEDRAIIKRNFIRSENQEAPKWNGVLAHYKVGGEGLTMTAATEMIILDEPWNPGGENQAMARIRRIGQTEKTGVHIFRMRGKGCLDKWQAQLIEQKRQVIEGFDTEVSFQSLAEIFFKMDDDDNGTD